MPLVAFVSSSCERESTWEDEDAERALASH